MLRINYKVGNNFKEIKEFVNFHEKNMDLNLFKLGSETSEKMKEIIVENKVRPQAGEPTNLENNIDVEYFPNRTGWGVGNILKLNRSAIYWRAFNFGSRHLIGKKIRGSFAPGDPKPNPQAFRTGRIKKGYYTINIENPIPATNFIEKTVNFVRSKIIRLRMRR